MEVVPDISGASGFGIIETFNGLCNVKVFFRGMVFMPLRGY